MIEIIKQLLVLLSALSAVLTSMSEPMFGAASEVDTIQNIEVSQDSYYQVNGKYQKSEGTDYSVGEYVSLKGAGYQITFTKEENGFVWFKSEGYGPEAVERTYDWKILREIPVNIASTTP